MADIKIKQLENGQIVEMTYDNVQTVKVPLADGSGEATFFTPIENGYTVTFKNGDEVYAISAVTAGDSVSAPNENPTKSGYVFNGWGVSLVTTEPLSFPYTPTADITLYAIYSLSTGIIGCTGFDNATGNLTWTDDIAYLQNSAAYTTSTSGNYVSLTGALENKFPFSQITEYTDSSGNVFTRFPKMYWKWVTSGNVVTGFKVSNTQIDSSYFIPDCFLNPNTDVGGYLDYVDIGKYEGSGSSLLIYSKSGATCLVGVTRAICRTAARNYGNASNYYNGYQQYDFSMMTMYNYLVNLFVRTANIQNVYVGRTIQTDGASVTGSCDGVTGRNGWNILMGCVKFLGVENPYGNISKWVDGVYMSDSTIYAHRYPTQFADSSTNGIALGFPRPTSSAYYISAISRGVATTTQSYVYCSANNSTTATRYYGDFELYHSGDRTLCVGGSWDANAKAGLWYLNGYYSASTAVSHIGCRLCHRPI